MEEKKNIDKENEKIELEPINIIQKQINRLSKDIQYIKNEKIPEMLILIENTGKIGNQNNQNKNINEVKNEKNQVLQWSRRNNNKNNNNNNNNIQNGFEKADIYYKRNSKSLSNKYKSKQKMQFKNSESFTNEDEDFYKINRPRIHTHNNKIDKNDKIKKI